ncbi:hypothetical protein DERF_014717 [Dermatophagoides farinae]|uniref:Uncharacterized protein n=1 Tax=Dermatophagoides farinae TaxID=6954 RepID=A0A922KTL8_DERFA|nr:hypothetical protein DERF_014717 [Dermatophagoides farinae]
MDFIISRLILNCEMATFPLSNAENVSVNFTLFNADNVSVDFTYYCQRQGNFLRQKCKTSMNRFIFE